jgi:hypothetical protein
VRRESRGRAGAVIALLLASAGPSCSKERAGGGATPSPSGSALAAPPVGFAPVVLDEKHSPPHSSPRPPPSGPPATVLSPDAKARVTVIRVAARKGAVIIRKHDGRWMLSGPRGCEVSPERIAAALNNLAKLTATKTNEPSPDGTSIELQIVAQIGQVHALHFEVAGSDERGTLVRLVDDSTRRVRGLDLALWRADPGVWCAVP